MQPLGEVRYGSQTARHSLGASPGLGSFGTKAEARPEVQNLSPKASSPAGETAQVLKDDKAYRFCVRLSVEGGQGAGADRANLKHAV